MRQNAHARLIKQVNTGTLLKHIRDQGPISRAELVKTTKLSPTTVSVIVEELLQEGLVTEVGMGESSGGRRPILLEFQPKARLAVGVDIGVRKSTVAILDLLGNTLLSQSYVPNLENKQLFMQDIIHHISEILQASKSLEQDILGIGVATPGLLDREKKNIVYSSSLGFTDVPLYEALEQHFSLPIRIDNDMNAAALGEKVMGAGRNISHLIYVSVETGIGAGIIIDDRIYDGATGGAGEFGHTTVEPAGAPCKCGNRGCLGVMAAEPAMISRAIQMLTIGAQTKIRDYHQGAPAEISLESLVLAARDYDPVALSIINDCLDYLAIGIANLINLFSPAAIILGGSTMETLHPMGIERVRHTVSQRVIHGAQRSYTIVPSQLKDRVKIVGASTLVFSEFLDYVHFLAPEKVRI